MTDLTKEELTYMKQDDVFIADTYKALLEKRNRYCPTCPENKRGICQVKGIRMPIKKINYCSRWWKED